MWKKINLAMVLGLACCPGVALAEFDPFAGLVQGIAQNLVVSGDKLSVESNRDASGVSGGNVVIGSTFSTPPDDVLQKASADTGVDLITSVSTGERQGVNVLKGEVAVLAMQDAAVTGITKITSNSSTDSVQGINLVTACGSAGCE